MVATWPHWMRRLVFHWQTDSWDGVSVISVHILHVHFVFFDTCSRTRVRQEGGRSRVWTIVRGVLRDCVHTVALCWTRSAYSTSVSAQVKPGVCSCCCLLLVKKLINLRCSFSVLHSMNTGVKMSEEERSECTRFTRGLVFYRKRYLRFYILGPTRKMFDVHILSINVDIHYISVLIKYFFSRGNLLWLCVWKETVHVCVCSRYYSFYGDLNLFTQSHYGDLSSLWGQQSKSQ